MKIDHTLMGMFVISVLGATVTSHSAFAQRDESVNISTAILSQGVASGDVTSDSAVIWSRANTASIMHVLLHGKGNNQDVHQRTHVSAEDDFTGKLVLTNLKADTDYVYSVWFNKTEHNHGRMNAMHGHFHTAPRADKVRPVSFAWGGDLAGQNTCRDAKQGFPIFKATNAMQLDFFIGLGDMIYADGTCEATGRYGNAQVAGDFLPSADMPN